MLQRWGAPRRLPCAGVAAATRIPPLVATVLILYPGNPRLRRQHFARYRWKVRALGFRTVLADEHVSAEDAEIFDEVVAMPPAAELAAARAALAPVLGRRRIDAVLAQWEPSLPLGSLLGRELAVPGPSPEAAFLTINKLRCRIELAGAGVGVPAFARVATAAEVRRFADQNGYPVVLKAASSALCRLVTFVPDAAAVEAAVEALRAGLPRSPDVARLTTFAAAARLDPGCDPEREFLVESYAQGALVETDGVLYGREPLTFGISEQVLTPPPRFRIEGYLVPADGGEERLERIAATSDAALAALGLADTGFSIEMVDGQAGVAVIEVNGRLGWDEGLGELLETRTGSQPIVHAAFIALGRRPRFDRPPRERAALAYASCHEAATVVAVPDRAQLKAIERQGHRVGLNVEAGARIFDDRDFRAAPHLAWVLAKDRTSSRAAYAAARTALAELRFELDPTG